MALSPVDLQKLANQNSYNTIVTAPGQHGSTGASSKIHYPKHEFDESSPSRTFMKTLFYLVLGVSVLAGVRKWTPSIRDFDVSKTVKSCNGFSEKAKCVIAKISDYCYKPFKSIAEHFRKGKTSDTGSVSK